jgi:hypothetical protein
MVAVFFLNSKTAFKCFIKIETEILDVDNLEIYKTARSQFEILCILAYRKKDKSDKISSLENMYCLSRLIFSFLLSLKYNVLDLNFLHTSLIIIYIKNFHFDFLEYLYHVFDFFKLRALWSSGAICPCPAKMYYISKQ